MDENTTQQAARPGRVITALWRYPDVVEAIDRLIAAEREACAALADYQCKCGYVEGEGYRGSGSCRGVPDPE